MIPPTPEEMKDHTPKATQEKKSKAMKKELSKNCKMTNTVQYGASTLKAKMLNQINIL